MRKVTVKMMNGSPIGLVEMENGQQRTMSGKNLIEYLGRIDESLIGRKVRRNPFIKNDKESIIYISKLHNKNIRIENNNETINALYDLYLENRDELRNKFDELKKKKNVKVGATVLTGIMIGGLALSRMGSTAQEPIDLEITATYNDNIIREANSVVIEEIMNKDGVPTGIYKSNLLCRDVWDISQVFNMSNEYAPEHLIISTDNYLELADKVVNAGSVFLGKFSCESAGDYASGTNHTLPTNGYAKSYSGVSLDSFIRKITFQELTAEGIAKIGPAVEEMAKNEQLDAHRNAMTLRLNSIK